MFNSIVVGTDGSPTATRAVSAAADLARTTGARLHILTVVKGPSAVLVGADVSGVTALSGSDWEALSREDLETILDDASRIAGEGLSVQAHSSQGDPADALIELAERVSADLIVVGNRGMTGARRFLLGSVPNRVSHHAGCSVLIVRTS